VCRIWVCAREVVSGLGNKTLISSLCHSRRPATSHTSCGTSCGTSPQSGAVTVAAVAVVWRRMSIVVVVQSSSFSWSGIRSVVMSKVSSGNRGSTFTAGDIRFSA
jgi:hypothetical protein